MNLIDKVFKLFLCLLKTFLDFKTKTQQEELEVDRIYTNHDHKLDIWQANRCCSRCNYNQQNVDTASVSVLQGWIKNSIHLVKTVDWR